MDMHATPTTPGTGRSLRVAFVDLSGETYIRYTPLACFYLQAAVAADAGLAVQVETRVHEFTQGHTTAEMIREVVAWEPDVIAMSCQGWNFRQLAATFAPIKQFVPGARLVLGGNHVTHRAERLLPAYPEVDVLVNGEGEFTIVEYLRALLDGGDLRAIAGLSYRGADGIVTTAERPRTRQMGEIPSPYALAGVDYTRYDVALLETNRGCPYACAFCYWGGRIGQKIARGELERVQAEIEVIGKAKIQTIFLCDANFGILAQDVEVARMIVASYQRYGAPSEFNVNWAKNHSSRVGEIVGILRAGGVRTTINIPLQTLSSKALQISGRSEIGRRAIVELAMGLVRDGTELFCELIFGMPGESLADFRRNYDELYLQFPILRIHPLWLLPNTEYQNRRAELGIRTHSPDPFSDYEAVLAHRDMPIADTMDGLALLLAHSILSLLGPARDVLRLLARHDARSVAAMLCALEPFLARREDPLATGLAELFSRIRRACYFERSLRDRKRELLYRSRADT
jgi:radical SAM superfamily enzyme YgiQ (UPF0313 family)